MDNKGHFCDLQPSGGSFYATPQGEMCLSRFECLPHQNASLNGHEFACGESIAQSLSQSVLSSLTSSPSPLTPTISDSLMTVMMLCA